MAKPTRHHSDPPKPAPRLADAVRARGWTGPEFERHLGLGRGHYHKLVSGGRHPRVSEMAGIARILDMELHAVYNLFGISTPVHECRVIGPVSAGGMVQPIEEYTVVAPARTRGLVAVQCLAARQSLQSEFNGWTYYFVMPIAPREPQINRLCYVATEAGEMLGRVWGVAASRIDVEPLGEMAPAGIIPIVAPARIAPILWIKPA